MPKKRRGPSSRSSPSAPSLSPRRKVFVSHSSVDLAIAQEISGCLEDAGYDVFLAPESIDRALWQDAIGNALQSCDWFLVILSPAATCSMWVKREVVDALGQQRLQHRIVPVLFKECTPSELMNLSWVLRQYQQIDFRTDITLGKQRLVQHLQTTT